MLSSVGTLKEKLRATLSEPNKTSEKSRKLGIGGSEDTSDYLNDLRGHALSKSKSTSGNTRKGSGGSRERRARWVRDKMFNHAPLPLSPTIDVFDNPLEKFDSGFHEHDQPMTPTRFFEENEKTLSPGSFQKIPNNNEPLNYKNKWKYRGCGARRNTHGRPSNAAITEIDENETETDDQLNVHRYGTILPSHHPHRNLSKIHGSPIPSQCSISSDSEGERDNSQNPSNMLNNSDQSPAKRKQSIFFASYGVWSEESVRRSFRELTPSITSILEAAWSGQLGIMEDLLTSKENLANINCNDTKGRTALHLASCNGHAGVVDLLILKGAEVDPYDTFEHATPLMTAAASGSLATVGILLEAGANVNAGFEVGKTPLHWAVQAGSVECVKKLLESGAKQNPPLILSENPIHVAASTGDTECLQLLLDYGADASLCKGVEKQTALHIAAEEGNAACIRLLLKSGASTETQDARGRTPLMCASSIDAESTSALIEAGANPNAKDRDGRSALHCSINRGSRAAECLKILADASAEINAQDNFGYTALHLAAVNETSQCVSILLKNGADVTIKTKAGTTALTMLVRKIPDVMRYLVERLDAAVTVHDHEPGDPDCEIKLDFRAVVPNSERTFRGNSKLPERTYYQNPRKETDFLTCVLAAGNKKILSHPLSEAFLTLKWQRVRKFFWASLLFQIGLVLLFTVYVVDVYLIKCPAKGIVIDDSNVVLSTMATPKVNPLNDIILNNSNFITSQDPVGDSIKSFSRVKRSSSHFNVFSFNPTKAPKSKKGRGPYTSDRYRGNDDDEFEIGTRFLGSTRSTKVFATTESANNGVESELTNEETLQYKIECHSTESWLTVIWCLLLVFTASMIVKEVFQLLQAPISYVMSSENWGQWLLIASVLIAAWPMGWPYPDRKTWQYPAAAFGIWMGWGLMLLQVGRFPALGLYVQMLGKVAQNFGLVILGYACLLIAFALAFCVIFPGEPAYYSIPLAILKVLTMMVGEVDYEDLFYNPEDPLLYPITAHILHAAFVVIVTIVLMNLLVGLAVSDIQGLQKGAKLNRLSRQTALISRLESFIFSKKLQAILPKSIGLILQRSALLVPSSYNWSYYFRPNDPRDKRVSKELKLASLKVASARHSSRYTLQKVHTISEPHTPKQQFPVVSNVSTDAALRRMEQRLDSLQYSMDQIIHTLNRQMDDIKQSLNLKNPKVEDGENISEFTGATSQHIPQPTAPAEI